MYDLGMSYASYATRSPTDSGEHDGERAIMFRETLFRGMDVPPCLRRVRALEQAGYIKGYRALLDEKKLGYEVAVFAMVHLASQAESDLVAFETFVRKEPLVRECWMLSGEIDFVLKCVAPDLKTFQAFVERLTAAPNVRNVKTSLTLRNSKDAAMVPMD